MPEKETLKRAREDKRLGKSPSTQAGEFVRDYEKGQRQPGRRPSLIRSRVIFGILRHEGHAAGLTAAISRHAQAAVKRRSPTQRATAARKAARTKGHSQMSAAGKKNAQTRKGS